MSYIVRNGETVVPREKEYCLTPQLPVTHAQFCGRVHTHADASMGAGAAAWTHGSAPLTHSSPGRSTVISNVSNAQWNTLR